MAMSRMFLNQVSTRELFTCGRDKRNTSSQSSDNNSQNMYLNSQKDFSENSQDARSQPFTGEVYGQEMSQGRRVFDRFMTKRTGSDTSFKPTPAKPGAFQNGGFNASMSVPGKQTLKPNFQQQVLLNKSKAKERDDREMFGTVITAVKENSDDIKGTIKTIQDNIEQLADTSNEKFSAVVNSIFDGLNENFERIVDAVKDREEKRTKIFELEREISLRDAKIEDLKSEVASQQSDRNQQIFESLNKVIQSYHMETLDKIEKMHEDIATSATYQHKLVDDQKRHHDKMERQQKENYKSQSSSSDELRNGLISELQQLRQELEDHRNQLEDFYSTQLSTTHYKNMKEIQYHISSSLDRHTEQSRDFSRDLCNFQMGKIKDICQNHFDSQENFLKMKMEEQAILRNTANEQILRKLEQFNHQEKVNVKDKQLNQTNDYQMKRMNNFESRNVERQLDMMCKRYNKELSEMRSRLEFATNNKDSESYSESTINERGAASIKAINHKTSTSPLSVDTTYKYKSNDNYFKDARNNDCESRKDTLFNGNTCNVKSFSLVSPEFRKDSTWNNKPNFIRPNPSPVVAVLPQPQNTNDVESYPKSVKHEKKGKKAKKAHKQPSRKSQRLVKMQTEEDMSDSSQSQNSSTSQAQRTETVGTYATFTKPQGKLEPKQIRPFNDSQKSHLFKVPQSIRRTVQKPFSAEQKLNDCETSSTSYYDRKPLQQNVFPVRPSTYSCHSSQRRPTQVSAPQPSKISGQSELKNNQLGSSQTYESKSSYQSVYDFRDSPIRKSHGISHPTKRRHEVLASSQSTVDASSKESSPSLSITKVIIQRKVKSNKRPSSVTPSLKRESQMDSEVMSDDFLNTPIMEDRRNSSDKWESQSVASTYRRSGEKRKLFNFDLGRELLAIKKAFKMST